MMLLIVSIVEGVHDASEFEEDMVDEVDLRNDDRKLRGRRERLPKWEREGDISIDESVMERRRCA